MRIINSPWFIPEFVTKIKGMKILFLLIGISLIVALCFLAAFIWAVRNGQYDDEYTPSVRILFDESKKGK